MVPQYDLIIVGAGPAGISLALALAKKGIKLVLLELKASFERGSRVILVPKELVPRGVKGLPCRRYFVNSLTHIREVETRTPYIFAETAEILAAWSQLLSPGLLKFSYRVSEIEQKPEYVALKVEGAGSRQELTCRIVAAGDGPYSISNRTFQEGPPYVRAFEYEFGETRGKPGALESFHTHRYSPGLYAWIFHLSHKRMVCGLGTASANPRHLLDAFIKEHPRPKELALDRRKVIHRRAGLLSCGRGRLVSGRVVFIGDSAAGYPWLGGMTYPGAKKAAELAAEPILKAIASGNEASLKEYERAWEAAFGKSFDYEQKARAAFANLTDDQIDQAYASRPGQSLRKVVMEYNNPG